MAYPPEHLKSYRRRITALPILAFSGLIESAPISWEEMKKAIDIAEHHHMQHRIIHDFNGDEAAYLTFIKTFGDRPRPSTTRVQALDAPTSDTVGS